MHIWRFTQEFLLHTGITSLYSTEESENEAAIILIYGGGPPTAPFPESRSRFPPGSWWKGKLTVFIGPHLTPWRTFTFFFIALSTLFSPQFALNYKYAQAIYILVSPKKKQYGSLNDSGFRFQQYLCNLLRTDSLLLVKNYGKRMLFL